MSKTLRIWLLIFIFSTYYSAFSIVKHLRFETNIFDLGYYDQLLWMVAHGKGLSSSLLEYHPWIDHFNPSFYLLVPLYWFWSNPVMLLIAQAVGVCLGAYPIYQLSRRSTKNELFSLAISFSYLSFWGIQNAISYEFHPIVFIPTLLAFVFWFYAEKKFTLFWVATIVLAGVQENALFVTGALGLFLLVRFRDIKRGLVISVGSGLFLIFLIYVLIPRLGSTYYYYPSHLNSISAQALVRLLYTPASKTEVIGMSFLSFGFLPLLSPASLILLIEEFVTRFVGTLNTHRWVITYHYNAPLAAILAFAAIDGVRRLTRQQQHVATGILLVGSLVSLIYVSPETLRLFNPAFYDVGNTQDINDVLARIPIDASVAATNNLGAHLSQREDLIFLTNCRKDPSVWGGDGKRCFQLEPDYIVGDFKASNGSNDYYPDYSQDALIDYMKVLEEKGSYALEFQKGSVYLFKKLKS